MLFKKIFLLNVAVSLALLPIRFDVHPGAANFSQSSSQARVLFAPPPTPPNFHLTNRTQTTQTFAWDDVSGETGYRLYLQTGFEYQLVHTLPANTTSFTDTNLPCGQELFYRFTAFNPDGESNWTSTDAETIVCDFEKTSPANGATGIVITPTLQWEYPVGDFFTVYCIDTIDNDTCDTSWKDASGTSAALSSLNYSTTYYWQVTSHNNAGATEANEGQWWSFTTRAAITTPKNFRLTEATQTSLAFAWDDVSGETGYRLYLKNGSTFALVHTIPANQTSFTDTNLPCGEELFYRFTAYNSNGESDWTTTDAETVVCDFNKTSPANNATNIATNPTLRWESANGEFFTTYCVDTTNNNSCDTGWHSASGTSAALSGLSHNTNYYWQVISHNNAGSTPANDGAWWSFKTQAAPFFIDTVFYYVPMVIRNTP